MSEQILQNILDETISAFRSYKKLAERAFEQVSDEEFFEAIDAESNSLATICKHIGGNLRSRWTDFLRSNGEKSDRNRDAEFVTENDTRESILQTWENGFQTLFDTLESLTTEDLEETITIRGEELTVVKAVNRSLAHTISHIGQIMFLAKHLRVTDWKTLSIPRNKSAEFTGWLKSKENKGNYLEATEDYAKENSK